MHKILLAAVAGLMVSGSAVVAQTTGPVPPQGLVWRVLTEMNAFSDDVENPANNTAVNMQVPDGVLVPVEVNHDGKTDWLIAWPEEMAFCGTGGCARTLYVSGEFGLIRAFDRQALDFKIDEVDGEARVEAVLHHLNCDDERPDCRSAWTWDERSHRLVPRISSDGTKLLNGVGPAVIDDADHFPVVGQDTWPQALRNQWDESRIACPVDYNEGFETRRLAIMTAPDLNADGRSDWVVVPPVACDGEYPEHAFSIWTSVAGEGDGDVSLAYAGGAGTTFQTDLGAPRPHVEVSQPCSGDEDCPYVPLRWNARTRMLEE